MITRKIGQNRGLPGEGRHSVAEVAQASALDTSHLDAQVCGDPQLREELLRLYAETLAALAPVLAGAPGRARQEAAHKLKGASLAIGAFGLARLCEGLEKEAGAEQELSCRGKMRREPSNREPLRREVTLAIEATRRRIMELLGTGRG
jgi:HPt (histidine-containing phosphotransfer) domain-containing protein